MARNLRISGAQVFPYSESDIRVNFHHQRRIIAAANADIGTIAAPQGQGQFYSEDHGETWGQSSLPLLPGDILQSDPAVDWTSDGTAWATTIGIDGAFNLRMLAYKSADGGATWTFDANFSGAQTNADKDMMWVDHGVNSPFKDNIYTIWHNGGPAFVNRRIASSGTWQAPLQVSGAETTGTGIGGDIKTNGFGEVFAFWPDTGSQNLFVAKSTNGGAGFGAPVAIATTSGSFDIGFPADASRRALIYITAGAYRTATKNLVYAAWLDLAGGAGCNTPGNEPGTNVLSACKTRIWFSRSTDGGTTWEPARKINDQPGLSDQFHPRLAIDETNGRLVVVYYDTVLDPGRLRTDVWMQISSDDGLTWHAPIRVTTASTDETAPGADINPAGPFFGDQYGDYIGLSVHDGRIYPCWTDRRSAAREEIWTALIRIEERKEEEKEEEAERGERFTGKIAGLMYDHFGDFEGFLLETDEHEHHFRSREHRIEELVKRAWSERIVTTVFVERHERQRPKAIVLRGMPPRFDQD
jgi:hypothetical protein